MPDIPIDRTESAVALPPHYASRVRDSATRGRFRSAMLAVALSLALLLVIWWPFLSTATFNAGQADWRYRANYMSYAVKSFFTYGQIPFWATAPQYHQLWSPDAHGFFSNPETEVISPYVLLYGFLGFGTAVRVSLLLHLAIGVAGLCALLAFLGVRHWSIVALCAVLVYGSGFFVRHILVGHLQFVSYTYFPAALWLYLRALHSARLTRAAWTSLSASGLAVALAYYEGNIHLVIQFLFVLASIAAFTALLSPGARVRAITTSAGVIVSFFLLAAFKLLPGIAEYGAYRPNDMNTYRSVRQFVDNVLYCLPSPPWPVPHELGFYLGIPGAVIVTIGLLNIRKSTLPLVATAFLFLILLFAPFGQLLVYVPLLGTQRPTRLRSEVILLAAVLSAQALSRMRDHLSRSLPRVGRIGFTVLVLGVAALVVRDEATALRTILNTTRQDVLKLRDGRVIALHNAGIFPPVAMLDAAGMGTISMTGDGPNAFSIVYRGTASDRRPAIIRVPDVTAREASLALSVAGAERADIDGRLALRVNAPTATIRIAYASSWMTAGLWCTGLGLAVFSCLVVSALAGRRRTAAPPALPA